MSTVFYDPTITDILRIPSTMASLKSLSMMLAYALMGLLLPLEVLRQNISTIENRNEYTGMFIRVGLVFLGLILYEQIFEFLTKTANIVELSILSEKKWSDLLALLAEFFETRKVTFVTSLPLVFTWLASFLALLAKNVLYWVRFALLSLLYFIGPIAFVFHVFGPTSFISKAWFKNVIQLSLWTVVMKVIVRVMLELQVMTYLTSANADLDVLTLVGINTTFVVMIVLSPHFTAQFVSGQTFGPFAVMASTYMAAKGWSVTKVLGNPLKEKVFGKTMSDRNTWQKMPQTSKTALRDKIFNSGSGKGSPQ